MGPIYQNQSYNINQKSNNDFVNPGATIYIISGDSGNNYFMDGECKHIDIPF